MKYELSQEFYFDAAHTLERVIDTDASRRIHGHTYHARITISGIPNQSTGMIIDLGHFKDVISQIQNYLDHRFLDEIEDLKSATLENLCEYIWKKCEMLLMEPEVVQVERKTTGDRCILRKG